MSDYTRLYNLTIKDSLPSGNTSKVIKGAELDAEYNAIVSAIASKSDINSPTFTGTPLAPTASFGTNTTQLATTAFVQAALQAIYPVGSVYINASVSTNPSTLLGFGTWVTVGDGKVIVNQDTTDTDFDVLGETGGSKSSVSSHTHTYSGATAGASSDHTHSVNDPGHSHLQSYAYTTGGGGISSGAGVTQEKINNFTNSSTTGITLGGVSSDHAHAYSGTTASTGTSNGNLQPYVVVRMWKRTA